MSSNSEKDNLDKELREQLNIIADTGTRNLTAKLRAGGYAVVRY